MASRLATSLQQAGAKVYAAGKLTDALYLAEHPALSAAVVNVRVGDDSTARICRRLSYLGIPFMFHTRYDTTEAARSWPAAPVVRKPANSALVVDTVARLVH